jgi:glycosyltransferase involved in cell wall biosynthesis
VDAIPQPSPCVAAAGPLRVVMLIPYDLYRQPFTIRSIRFADLLARRGHQVTLFHREVRGAEWSTVVQRKLPDTFEVRTLGGTGRSGARAWRTLWDAVGGADVVHYQKSNPQACVPALLLGKLHGKPIHHDWDDHEFLFWTQAIRDAWADPSLGPAKRARELLKRSAKAALVGAAEWIGPKVADTVGAASSELRRTSLRLGTAPGAIFPARVGVDADRFHPDARDPGLRARLGLRGPTVLFSGSLDLEPDLVFFAEALRCLVARVPDARCLVLGGGMGRRALLRHLAAAGVEHAVVMSDGYVPFGEMPRHIASCDVAAVPFRDTRMNRGKSSLTLLECMACGVPIVTHDVGDAAWMVGDGGVLARLEDPADFAARIAALFADAAARTELGARARRRAAERFGWETTVDSLEAAYRAAIERHAARSGRDGSRRA